jgi:hypothetical protein
MNTYVSNPEKYAWNLLLSQVQFTQDELLLVKDWITIREMIRYQKSLTKSFLEKYFSEEIDESLEVDWNDVDKYVKNM